MSFRVKSKLDPRKKYLQVALNGTLDDARRIINQLPLSDRIIVEAGTPLIKRYGEQGIRMIRQWFQARQAGQLMVEQTRQIARTSPLISLFADFVQGVNKQAGNSRSSQPATFSGIGQSDSRNNDPGLFPYVVADLKTMDRGGTEVEMAARAGASAAVALGSAPKETLDFFIEKCQDYGLDAMIDMMNVEYPLAVLRSLKKVPPVVIIHRGVDEEQFNKQKQIPLHEIRRIKGSYDIMISIAGGDTLREVQRAVFNDADIVVVWKSVFQATGETIQLVEGFLKEVK